jgi:hypothetical protein
VSVQILHPTGPPKLGEIAIEGGTEVRAAG